MQQEAGLRQAEAVFAAAGEEDQGAGAGDPAGADHADRGLGVNEADHVVDGVAAFDVAAGGVDVDVNGFGAGAGEGEQAAGDVTGDAIVDGAEDQDLALLEQAVLELVDQAAEGAVAFGFVDIRAFGRRDVWGARLALWGVGLFFVHAEVEAVHAWGRLLAARLGARCVLTGGKLGKRRTVVEPS